MKFSDEKHVERRTRHTGSTSDSDPSRNPDYCQISIRSYDYCRIQFSFQLPTYRRILSIHAVVSAAESTE